MSGSATLAMRRMVTRPLRRSILGNCLVFAAHNQLGRLRLLRGDICSDSGMAHDSRSLDSSLNYIRTVFEDYKREAGIAHFHGRAAEVGPGDNCGVAMLLLADGCGCVDLVDRFYSERNEAQQSGIYRALVAGDARLRALFGDADREADFPGIKRHYGADAAAETFFCRNKGYDLIVSRAVMEHLRDPVVALKHMVGALRPGGLMIHVVDLRDHGMFSGSGFAETKFLEIPDTIFRLMTDAVGRPNRVPLGGYTRALDELPVRYSVRITHLVGGQSFAAPAAYNELPREGRSRAEQAICEMRSRLARSLRHEPTENLAVSGFVVVAQRIQDSTKGDGV